MEYKDILNTFGWDKSYADRFQAAALKGDSTSMQNIVKEYKGIQDTWNSGYWEWAYNQYNWKQLWNWNYWEDTERRQQEIVSNLNEAYANNPEQFKDWSTFTQNFDYDYEWRSNKERDTMRNWYNNTMWWMPDTTDYNNANNTDYFLTQLIWGNQLAGEWAAIDAARNRYNAWKVLSGMTPEQLVSAVSSNAISPVWQEMQDLKQYSPALYAQVQAVMQWQTAVNDINAVWDSIYSWLTWTETNWYYTNYDMSKNEYTKNASIIKQYNESLYKKIEWLWWDTAAYVAIVASMLQNPAVQASKNEVEDLEGEIRKIQEQIYTVWDTARQRLWSEAPEDLVSAYISQQTKNLQNQLRTTQNSLLVAQWKLNNQLTEVETMIDAINNGLKMEASWVLWTPETTTATTTPTTSTSTSYRPTTTTSTEPARDYQDDSDARLREIANNLKNLYNTNPELFKDRATFDNYFNYSKRSPKQKAVLDAFFTQKKWVLASTWRWWTWTGTWISWDWESSWGMSDDFVKAVKKDLLSGKILSLSASDMKKQYPQYWNIWRADSASASLVSKIGYISSLDEIEKLSTSLSDSLTDNLYKWYWSNPKSITTSANKVKSIWDWNTSKERQSITVYLNWLDISQAKREKILKEAWISDSNITKILSGK